MTFVPHVMLVMLVVSVVRWRRRFRRATATASDAAFRCRDATGRVFYRRRPGVALGSRCRRHTRFRSRATSIADTVAAACLARMMLVRAGSSTPTMVTGATVRRNTVVG